MYVNQHKIVIVPMCCGKTGQVAVGDIKYLSQLQALKPYLCSIILRDQNLSLAIRVFSEVLFWNSAVYGILYGIDFILRNSAKFLTAQSCGIPRNSV
jgi:hypothetical protein